jgi:D-3-phosphoglycerate dehydrogenase
MIGRAVAKRLAAFDTKLQYYDVFRSNPTVEESLGIEYVPFEELLSSSDIVTLHVPLSPQTRHMIGSKELGIMKKSAIIVNTCRGDVIDAEALYQALKEGMIAGAGLDTVEPEPPPPGFPLFSLPNVTATPHIAGHSRESWPKRLRNAFTNVQRISTGQPPLWVVPELRDLL